MRDIPTFDVSYPPQNSCQSVKIKLSFKCIKGNCQCSEDLQAYGMSAKQKLRPGHAQIVRTSCKAKLLTELERFIKLHTEYFAQTTSREEVFMQSCTNLRANWHGTDKRALNSNHFLQRFSGESYGHAAHCGQHFFIMQLRTHLKKQGLEGPLICGWQIGGKLMECQLLGGFSSSPM